MGRRSCKPRCRIRRLRAFIGIGVAIIVGASSVIPALAAAPQASLSLREEKNRLVIEATQLNRQADATIAITFTSPDNSEERHLRGRTDDSGSLTKSVPLPTNFRGTVKVRVDTKKKRTKSRPVVPSANPQHTPLADTSPPSSASDTTATPAPVKNAVPESSAPLDGSQTASLAITGFGYPDNDPPGSATIAYPQIHQVAGGTGTFSDPFTVAVATSSPYKAGDTFYFPKLKKYGIVEDQCASCAPQQLDLWVGGDGSNDSQVLACENAITGNMQVILQPSPGLPVESGDIAQSSACQA